MTVKGDVPPQVPSKHMPSQSQSHAQKQQQSQLQQQQGGRRQSQEYRDEGSEQGTVRRTGHGVGSPGASGQGRGHSHGTREASYESQRATDQDAVTEAIIRREMEQTNLRGDEETTDKDVVEDEDRSMLDSVVMPAISSVSCFHEERGSLLSKNVCSFSLGYRQ